MDWIDLALASSEEDLSAELSKLTGRTFAEVRSELLSVLGIRKDAFERAMLRVLIERARPLALPATLWARPTTSSSSISADAVAHLTRLGVKVTNDRVRSMQQLYVQFVVDRGRPPLTERALRAQNYRCGHCGLAFCNEDLVKWAFVSPFGARGTPKIEPLKPHWADDTRRLPRLDHDWPVSLFGDNSADNMKILCDGCNTGKAQLMALEQSQPFTGLPTRRQLTSRDVPFPLFYAQIRRMPYCHKTGKTAAETELTIELRDAAFPTVLDNLLTVESPGL